MVFNVCVRVGLTNSRGKCECGNQLVAWAHSHLAVCASMRMGDDSGGCGGEEARSLAQAALCAT